MNEFPPSRSGTYVLFLRSRSNKSVSIGRLGRLTPRTGHYLYVGSAFGPGGLSARINHHWDRPERLHWHIDYLRRVTQLSAVWYAVSGARREHDWARALGRGRGVNIAMARFGASDCRCASHLFYAQELPSITNFERRLRRTGVDEQLHVWLP